MAGILNSVLGTTPTKYTMTETGSRIIRNLHGLPVRNHGRNQAGLYSQRKTKKKMGVAVILRAFTAPRGSSGIMIWRSQRGRVWFNNKPKSTTRAVGARCWLSFHQGSLGGMLVISRVELDGVILILRCCSLS